MEYKNVDSSLPKESHSEIQEGLPREIDSLDDFEHLGHDSSPLKETNNSDLSASKQPARDGINNGVEISATAANLSEELSSFDPFSSSGKMDSNLLEMGDSFKDRKDDDKLDKFLQDLAPSAPPKHEEPPEIQNKDSSDIRSATQQFMDLEREPYQEQKKEEILEKYSDSEDDDFKPSKNEDFPKTTFLPEPHTDNFKVETFKDVEDEKQPEPPKKDYPSVPETAECKRMPETILPLPPQEIITPIPICKLPVCPEGTTAIKKGGAMDAEAIFCKMGLGKCRIL